MVNCDTPRGFRITQAILSFNHRGSAMKIFTLMVITLAASVSVYAQAAPSNVQYVPPKIIEYPKDRVNVLKVQAHRIATQLAESITSREPRWKIAGDNLEGPSASEVGNFTKLNYFKQQEWRAGKYEVELRVYVFEKPEDASDRLKRESFGFAVAGSAPLNDVGDEAYIIKHPYFTWIGTRRGSVLVTVHGPGGGLQYSRGFINLALPLMIN
jgi:hypothetical protein